MKDYTDKQYWIGIIKMSLSKFFILRALHEGPMHGYQLARTVERITQGCCSPSEGTIYPVLKEFQKEGYLSVHTETVNSRSRKVYALTEKGRQAFRVAVDAWMEITEYISESQEVASQ